MFSTCNRLHEMIYFSTLKHIYFFGNPNLTKLKQHKKEMGQIRDLIDSGAVSSTPINQIGVVAFSVKTGKY